MTSPHIAPDRHAEPGIAHAAPPRAVALILRAEALVEFALSLAAYRYYGGLWLTFGGLFLAPDLAMAGYAAGPRAGAAAYNMAHTFLAPAVLALIGVVLPVSPLVQMALIWAAHIAFDRAVGYGLKYPAGFAATHLGRRCLAALSPAPAARPS